MSNNPAPYSFDLDATPDPIEMIRRNFKKTDKVAYKGETYRYGVIDPAANDRVKRFAGMPGGNNLFVSQEVEPEYLSHWLRHEIECCRLRPGGEHCWDIEKELLAEAPEELRPHLIGTRCQLFLDLMNHYNLSSKDPPKEGSKKGIVETFTHLCSEMRRCSKEFLARELGIATNDQQWEEQFWNAMFAHMEPKNQDGHNNVREAVKRLPEYFREDAKLCMYQAVFALGGD